MKKITTIISFVLVLASLSKTFSQEKVALLIEPFLQDMEPHSVIIKWETSSGNESVVEYGLTKKIKQKNQGTATAINFSETRLHEVKLTGLQRFTTYFYRVKTGKTYSKIYSFKTPPFPTDRESFNLVAMSDMQFDYNYPNKFNEIVNQSLIPYMAKNYEGTLSDHLAFVMVPGDLVENGTKYDQWKNHFFNPAEKLFAKVPVYPVFGNHERNSQFYLNYFSLPKNGTPAYAEHWWYKDYGNTRIIGLDSNKGYNNLKEQFEWLKNTLKETAKNEQIDFVFAQLHHPHKSELWIPGELESTGKVIQMLENFTKETGKPSIHFFGHTHGYSRGQSKNHKHLWVNVASAGGAIDNWGEFEGRDYDEFTVTEDEYGFVLVEVDANASNPKFTLKRISSGNEEKYKDNVLTDSITIYKLEQFPDAPKTISPQKNEVVKITGTTLKAAPFKSKVTTAFHAASQWQVSDDTAFKNIILDSWKQHENWYYKENRQKNDDLTDENTKRLKPKTNYFWRVRYRDQNLNWSRWSNIGTFTTE